MKTPANVVECTSIFGILTRRGAPISATATDFIQSLRQNAALMVQVKWAANWQGPASLPIEH